MSAATMSIAELERWLAAVVGERCGFPAEEVEVDQPLVDYGFSSRDSVELAGRLEDLLGRALPTTLLWDHPTIQALAEALVEQAPRRPAESSSQPLGPDAIAVIGVGCRLPGDVTGPEEFWRLLEDGADAVGEVPSRRWPAPEAAADAEVLERTTRAGGFLSDIAGFDAEFFSISPREARQMDPQQRLMLEVGWEALEHAGISPESLRGTATGVFVGVSAGEYGARSLSDLSSVDAWSGTGGALSVAANRLSYALDLRGPSVAVDTACSSSLVAVHLGMQSLRSGDSDLVIAAGANLLLGPAVTAAFHQMGVISPTGRCRPFSASADGIVRAEGAGVVVLKRLSDALRDGDRVLAVLRGSAVNQDGHSNGITAPNVEAQEDLLRRAYGSAGVDPGEIDYVEAHGTGTLLGDPIEARALGAVLGAGRSEPLLIGSVKSNLGHLEAAAGITGLIKVVLSVGARRIPASLHYVDRHPHIDFEGLGVSVADRVTEWPRTDRPARAGVSAFGFGGTNAHVVVEEAPPPAATPGVAEGTRPGHFLLGGGDTERVRESAAQLAGWLEDSGQDARLQDVERTLARRLSGRARAGVVARDRESLVAGLRACASGATGAAAPNVIEGRGGRRDAGAVWVFSGQGSQWPGMGLRLMREEPEFAAALSELDALIQAQAGFSVCEELERAEELTAMERLQPVLFAVQVALSRLLIAHGAKPTAVVGHSLGEVAAAVAAGGLSVADGARVVTLRSRLLATLEGSGSMALLELSADQLTEMLDGRDGVELAAFNAPGQIAVAGQSAQVSELVAAVESRGLLAKLIKSKVPGHCMIVDPVVGALREGLDTLAPQLPHTRVYATALEDPRAISAFDAAYWAANIRRPVRFAQAIAAAAGDGHTSFIEISPHPVLTHALMDNARAARIKHPVVLSTGRRSEDETNHVHVGLTGLQLDRPASRDYDVAGARLIDLPRTSWHHEVHWIQPRTRKTPVTAHPLLGEPVELPDETRRLWRSELEPAVADGPRQWVRLSRWLEIARCAATEALPSRGAEVLVSDLELHVPLALGDRCTLTTSLELTAARAGLLTVRSRIAGGAWRTHLSAAVETVQQGVPGVPARLESQTNVLLTARPAGEGTSRSASWVLEQALEALVDSLGAAGDGAWLPRSVAHARWLGDLDDVSHARISTGGDAAEGERTASLQLADSTGRVRMDLGQLTLDRVSPAELPMALSEKLLSISWHPVQAPPAPAVRGRWLIVGDPSDPRTGELAAELRSQGAEECAVSAGAEAGVLGGGGPLDGVVVLAAPTPADEEPEDGPSRGERLVLTGAQIVQALSTTGSRTRIWFVTSGAAAVAEGELPDPGPAALRGLVRVLAYEHPELQPRWVDLDRDRGLEGLLCELAAGDSEDEVAWRAGTRHVARIGHPELPEIASGAARTVHADGAYLVSGGLGGLGLVLARWLAESGAARVVLNGRSGPGPRAQEELTELRGLGCEVVVVEGDIARPGVAERAVAACAAPGARFRGVIHAAAVIEDRVTLRLDADSLGRVWAAKAAGAWHLSAASEGFELDWWVGFSSAAALLGSPGQPAYAAANAYLDALTAWRRARGMAATTINWGTWSQVGRAADRRADAVSQITPAEGLDALTALLAGELPATAVLKLDPAALVDAFPELAGIPLFSSLVDGAATPGARQDDAWEGIEAVEPAEAGRRIAERVQEQIAAVLGVDRGRLDCDAPLTTLGLDSLLAVRIRNAAQHDFAVLLPPSLLLRGASINEVVVWLCETLQLSQSRPAHATAPVIPPRVAPRDASERMVAAIWEEVLGRQDFGVTDGFYGLGGDLPSANQVRELLSRRAGRPLHVSELFAEPTIERQAALLREDEAASPTPLRLLRSGGSSRPPLFLFHPGGGDTLVYRQLVDHLDPDLTVWGFDRLTGALSVEERAERYLELLRATQPNGPYLLAGWSFGGALAYETALRLHAAGERVELLAMIDTILPLPDPPGLSDAQILELRFQRFALFLEQNYGKPVSLPYERMARLDDEAQTEAMIEAIVSAGLIDPAQNAAIIRHQRTSYLDVRALERYRPARHDGPIVFYSARDMQTDGMRDPRFDRQDPSRGWNEICGEPLEVVSVPGHHLSLLDPPHVENIAAHLDRALGQLTLTAA